MENPRYFLDQAITAVSTSNNASVVSASNEGSLGGGPSASALLRYNQNGATHDLRSEYIMRNNKCYTITTKNVDQANFDRFINSFHFR